MLGFNQSWASRKSRRDEGGPNGQVVSGNLADSYYSDRQDPQPPDVWTVNVGSNPAISLGTDNVAKRKRNSKRGRARQRAGRTPPGRGTKQATIKTENQEAGGAGERSMGNEPQKPQGEWVTVEHRDAHGNPTFPRELIASTYGRRYGDVPDGTEIKVLVLAGYKPKALMLVERKIYEIHRLSMRGWRRIGQIAVEMEGWREHERDWFKAMRGVRLEIPDPSLPGPHNEKSQFVVSESSCGRKIVTSIDENGRKNEIQLYEGTLDITETWKSAWQRQAAEVLNMGFKNLLLPLLAALVAGLAVWWIDRSPIPADHDLETGGNPAGNEVRESIGDSASKPSGKSVNDRSPNVPAKQTAIEEQDPTNSAPKDGSGEEPATRDGAEELDRRPATSSGVEGHDSVPRKSASTTPAEVQEGEVPDNE